MHWAVNTAAVCVSSIAVRQNRQCDVYHLETSRIKLRRWKFSGRIFGPAGMVVYVQEPSKSGRGWRVEYLCFPHRFKTPSVKPMGVNIPLCKFGTKSWTSVKLLFHIKGPYDSDHTDRLSCISRVGCVRLQQKLDGCALGGSSVTWFIWVFLSNSSPKRWLDDIIANRFQVIFSIFPSQMRKAEQSCITVQIMLCGDQHATQRLLMVTSQNIEFAFPFLRGNTTMQTTTWRLGWTTLKAVVASLDYTTVHTVFSVVSNRTALASVGFMLVSYIGFSKDAWPLELSWPTYPLNWTFGRVLKQKKTFTSTTGFCFTFISYWIFTVENQTAQASVTQNAWIKYTMAAWKCMYTSTFLCGLFHFF